MVNLRWGEMPEPMVIPYSTFLQPGGRLFVHHLCVCIRVQWCACVNVWLCTWACVHVCIQVKNYLFSPQKHLTKEKLFPIYVFMWVLIAGSWHGHVYRFLGCCFQDWVWLLTSRRFQVYPSWNWCHGHSLGQLESLFTWYSIIPLILEVSNPINMWLCI